MDNAANYKIQAQKDAQFALRLVTDICGYKFTGIAEKNGGFVNLSVSADLQINLNEFLHAAAETFGLDFDIPKLFDIIVERLAVTYISGALSFDCEFGGLLKECLFSYKAQDSDYLFAFTLADFDLGNIPFICEFIGDNQISISNVSIVFSTKPEEYGGMSFEAGLSLAGNICGYKLVHLLKPHHKSKLLADNAESTNVFWVDINKKISLLTLHKAGFSYGGGDLSFMLDMSLAVSIFTLSVLGAGLRVNLDNKSVDFLLSGFGVEYHSSSLTVGGLFNKREERYTGALLIGAGSFKVTLIGDYERGHLLAYALVNANLGGPPAFFVTGIAAAFGYNKDIVLPDIHEVPQFPLVAAASGKPKISLAEMIARLDSGCIVNRDGQRFISAGIKFTTFQIAESFVMLNVCFGSKLTFSLLGVSNLSVPPMCDKNPVAFAQLALKVVVDPSEGIFSVQAQLTSESYVLSKNCRLTGGFAMFVWFGNHLKSGDFVISLGGYHPDYKKPAHYPDVPRLGLNWQITSNLSVTGEVYFALTPSCIMAGMRMAAVYKNGNLKAWFIAQADFMIQWKPFHYDARVAISLGASYTVDFWFVHRTFTIELSADMHFWGPEFAGRVRISWFIISFTIEFGDVKGKPPAPLTYSEFSQSFLPPKKDSSPQKMLEENSAAAEPLVIAVNGRLLKEKDGVKYVGADELSFLITSAVPVSDGSVVIRPMNDTPYESDIVIEPCFHNSIKREYLQSVPTAMWGGSGELRRVVGGYEVSAPETEIRMFPVNKFISLDELYKLNTQYFQVFRFTSEEPVRYNNAGTIRIFQDTANQVKEKRKAYLQKMGIENPQDVSLSDYTAHAETLLDEDILVAI